MDSLSRKVPNSRLHVVEWNLCDDCRLIGEAVKHLNFVCQFSLSTKGSLLAFSFLTKLTSSSSYSVLVLPSVLNSVLVLSFFGVGLLCS